MHDESLLPSPSTHFGRMKRSVSGEEDGEFTSSDVEAAKQMSMNQFHRSQRQLIPAPRVGRSKPIENDGLILGADKVLTSSSFSGEEDVDLDSDHPFRLLAIPKAFFSPKANKDLLKRVALTPRIGRSGGLSENNGILSYLEDADYFARISKAPLTPRIGRSVASSADGSADSSKA